MRYNPKARLDRSQMEVRGGGGSGGRGGNGGSGTATTGGATGGAGGSGGDSGLALGGGGRGVRIGHLHRAFCRAGYTGHPECRLHKAAGQRPVVPIEDRLSGG